MSSDPKKVQKLRSDRAELSLLIQKVSDLVRKSPQKAAMILTAWSHQPATRLKTKKTA